MSFTSNEALGLILLIGVIVLGIIVFVKKRLSAQTDDLLSKYHSDVLSLRVKKYPEVDTLGWYDRFIKVGLICSLSVVIMAFNWTIFEKPIDEYLFCTCSYDYYVIESEIPRTARIPLPPPPPPPIIEPVVSCEEVDIDFSDWETFEDFEEEEEITDEVVSPPIIEEEKEEFDIFFPLPDYDKPFLTVCESLESKEERDSCTEQELLKYIYQNINYS